MALKTKGEAVIIQQALIHSMNQLSCIPLPTVALLPDGMISQEWKVRVSITLGAKS